MTDWIAVCLSHGVVLAEGPNEAEIEAEARTHKVLLGCKIVVVGQKV